MVGSGEVKMIESACVVGVLVNCLVALVAGQQNGASFVSTSGSINPLRKRESFCPQNSECVPITSCPILTNILSNECVKTDRLGDLGCGYQGSGLVCCPLVSDAKNNINTGKMVDGQRCGVSQIQGDDSYDGIGAYPWVARIGFRNVVNGEVKYPCAGSIISNRIILTAAHCALAKADNYKLFSVRIGEWNSNSDIDCGQEFCGLPTQDIALSHVIVHPGFQRQTFRHNIALLVLRTPVNYTVTAQPICLPESWSVTNNNGLLVGWGRTATQRETPFHQQALHLPITSIQLCSNVYGNTLPISDEQLCAGGEAGSDACSGFGGAPLMVRHGDTHYQVGILSFGSDQCGAAGVPSVYTNVKKYITWIRENTPVVFNNP